MSDAVYIVEFKSISQGIGVLDKMFKRSTLDLLYANPICIGKYLICVGGDVADALVAQQTAEAPEEGAPIASYLLTGAHPSIREYFRRGIPPGYDRPEAIGIVETRNAASGFVSLDRALKSARVTLLKLWLGQLLGGKLCYVLGGGTSDIQSAVKAAAAAIPERELVGTREIPAPDRATMELFLKGGKPHEPAN